MQDNNHQDGSCVELKFRIMNIEKEIKDIQENCCSPSHMITRVEANQLLRALSEDVKKLSEDNVKVMEILNTYKKYMNMLIGGLIVFEFFGAGEKIKSLILG